MLRSYAPYWPVLIPHEDNFKVRSYSMYGPEGVAVLIPPGEKLRLRSYSMYWPEGMAVLSRMKISNKS